MLRLAAVLVLATLGCSSEEDEGPKGADPIPATLAPTPSPYTTAGSITIASNGSLERIIDALFAKTNPPTCTPEVVAGCTVATCDKTIETVVPVNPGKITISSPSIGENVELPIMMGRGRIVQGGA